MASALSALVDGCRFASLCNLTEILGAAIPESQYRNDDMGWEFVEALDSTLAAELKEDLKNR